MKKIFYIFIEHVDDEIFCRMHSFAKLSANLVTFKLEGIKNTMFLESLTALEMILSIGGVKEELLREFYS